MGVAPAFLACLGVETFHGAPPFGGGLGHFMQLGCSNKPTGSHGLGVPHNSLRGISPRAGLTATTAGCMPHQPVQQFAQPCAYEMVFQPRFFKPDAGGGEV